MVGRGQGSLITLGMRPEVGTLAFAEYKAQMELCTAGKPSCTLGAEESAGGTKYCPQGGGYKRPLQEAGRPQL